MNLKGTVSLTTVLLIGAMIVAGSTVLVLTTVDLSRSTQRFEYGTEVKTESRTCLEEAMYKLLRDPGYVGEVVYTNTDFSCVGVLSNVEGQPNQRSLTVTGRIEDYQSVQTYVIDISTEPFTIL